MTTRALATTPPMTGGNDVIRHRLIERERDLIGKTQTMLQALRAAGGWHTFTYTNIIRLAKQRLAAMEAGLLPVRLGGRAFTLATLINEGQYVPVPIVAKANEAAERFPQGAQRVYGWESTALPAERRRRDPVLVMNYGGENFFLGFWLEIVMPDEATPEFYGMTAPLLPKRGRGRPRKDQ